MIRNNEQGSLNALLFPLILTVLVMLGALGFGVWAFGERQDYKNNVDTKVDAAVKVAVSNESDRKDAVFAEESKNPLTTYKGPAEYASVSLQYPKTWSAYINEGRSGSSPIDGYFYPGFVPSLTAQTSSFALRMQVVNQDYAVSLQQFTGLVKSGQVTSTPMKLDKVSGVTGTRFDGKILANKTGSMVVIPVRDKTLKIWTEAEPFKSDFDKIVLPNLSFSP